MPKNPTFSSIEMDLLPSTQALFSEYCKKNEQGYKNEILSKLESTLKGKPIAEKPFSEIKESDIKKYIDLLYDSKIKSTTIASRMTYLKSFVQFLKDTHPDIYPPSFLADYDSLRKKPKAQQHAETLDYIQISAIRDFIRSNPRMLYFFELVFQTTVKKDDIVFCIPENCDPKRMEFRKNGRILCKYNSFIQEIIDSYINDTDLCITPYDRTSFLKSISDYLRSEKLYKRMKDIIFLDIRKSQKRFFLKCPNPKCDRIVENSMSNWVLVKTGSQNDGDYHLFCKYCRGSIDD